MLDLCRGRDVFWLGPQARKMQGWYTRNTGAHHEPRARIRATQVPIMNQGSPATHSKTYLESRCCAIFNYNAFATDPEARPVHDDVGTVLDSVPAVESSET